jgi:hypothetical protein
VIKAYRTFDPLQQGAVQSAIWHEDLARNRDTQAAQLMPRSDSSWAAEQQRLGSWRSGQGTYRPSGVGTMYQPGVNRPKIRYRWQDQL